MKKWMSQRVVSASVMLRPILVLVLVLVLGCQQQQAVEPGKPVEGPPDNAYLLPAEPSGAQDVSEVRAGTGDDASVVVTGRIGGSENPWVEGRAAFSLVDHSLQACSDIEGDQCEMPWDYCCETDRLAEATVLVKVVDAAGDLVTEDARQLLGVKELQTVVVQGTAQRDEAGNVTVLASGIYVRP